MKNLLPILTIGLIGLVLMSFIPASQRFSGGAEFSADRVSSSAIYNRLNSTIQVLDASDYAAVKRRIYSYFGSKKRDAEILLGRAPVYLPLIEEHLRNKNLPEDLKYLPIVESALNPKARSNRGAVGLWQLMPRIARLYGLEVNSEVDERRDPNKSTEAALNYLKDLYDQYEDWTLALAAYNCGTPRLNKSIRLGQSTDYWQIRQYLPKETQRYIPKLLASIYLINYYQHHFIVPDFPDFEMMNTRSVKLYDEARFEQIADLTKVSLKTIQKLNPSYKRGIVPANEEGNYLILPRTVEGVVLP